MGWIRPSIDKKSYMHDGYVGWLVLLLLDGCRQRLHLILLSVAMILNNAL